MNQKDQKEYSQKRHNEARKQYNAGVKQSEKQEAKAKAEQRLEEGGDISEEEAKALTHAILYSQAQITAKRRKRG